MPHYHVRFLKGPNMTLRLYHDSIETAESFEQVLRRHTTWPIQISWDHLAATAGIPVPACIIRKCGKLPS